MIEWDTDEEESRTIGLICDRAMVLIEEMELPEYTKMDMSMDISAAHLNGCPLALDKFLTFQTNDFLHDIFGIRRYLDRGTGEVGGHFLPRCALPESKK